MEPSGTWPLSIVLPLALGMLLLGVAVGTAVWVRRRPPVSAGTLLAARIVLGVIAGFPVLTAILMFGGNLNDPNYMLRFLVCLVCAGVLASLSCFPPRKKPASEDTPATTPRACPRCGRALTSDTSHGLCPACLLQQAASGESGAPHPSSFMPPSIAELAALFPQLEIIELLGRGGMGAVYKARQPGLDRFVALKVLPATPGTDPSFTERFQREARALASLNHPHIVAVYDFGQLPTMAYFIMEYVDGINLRQLERTARLSPREALAIVPQVCEALQFAHDHGIVHRDIKPENILVDKQGRVKIADFGLAKLMRVEPGGFALTETLHAIGTPQYMAPEQIEKPQTVDHRADIYSLGVVFYEMLTGELPLGRFAPPSHRVQMDVRLDEVVLKTLEKEPERRYQQVSEVKTNVETIGTGPLPPVTAATPPVRKDDALAPATSSPRFSRVALVGAIWLTFGVVIFRMVLFSRPDRPVPGGEIHQHATPLILQTLGILLLVTAPLGTTLCGAVSMSQIRHSAGRLCGLGLAVFDLLFYPLLILDAALIAGAFILLS
jgi:serine/threonine protein kinase